MATYYHGNGGDSLQTLILINPSHVGINSGGTQQTSNQESPTTNSNNLVYPPHAPPHYLGVPLSADAANLVPMVGGQAARELPHRQQGLSLSLSSDQRVYSSTRVAGASPHLIGASNDEMVRNQVLLGSKYIRAAQELLDEAVSVGKGVEGLLQDKGKGRVGGEPSVAPSTETSAGAEGGWKRGGSELSTAERQEIQMKKAKLVNMLDEVEQKYRQYHKQMHVVISWFEQVAGLSSAKTYTALALQTISKQFRCLKDAILNQIKLASKSLGEEEGNNKIKGSRLKYVDNQIRQQRALQQLGMVQHNAWRPQRGLPERAVSVLRAWLFEHFLHPYPKDSDKITLAKQTGLTRSQVSNWFINARVRLWKPMVEEMYTEEMKEHEKNNVSPSSSDHTLKTSKREHINEGSSPNPANHQPQNTTTFTTSNLQENHVNHSPGFNFIVPSEMYCSSNSTTPKKLRMSHTDHHQLLHNSLPNTNLMTSMNIDSKQLPAERADHEFTLMGVQTDFMGGFGSYPIAELAGRFGPDTSFHQSGNSVSLTLGLTHCENNNNNLSITTAHHQGFMPSNHRVHEIAETSGMNEAAASSNTHSTSVYESINIQERKRFVAQLLPDFVA